MSPPLTNVPAVATQIEALVMPAVLGQNEATAQQKQKAAYNLTDEQLKKLESFLKLLPDKNEKDWQVSVQKQDQKIPDGRIDITLELNQKDPLVLLPKELRADYAKRAGDYFFGGEPKSVEKQIHAALHDLGLHPLEYKLDYDRRSAEIKLTILPLDPEVKRYKAMEPELLAGEVAANLHTKYLKTNKPEDARHLVIASDLVLERTPGDIGNALILLQRSWGALYLNKENYIEIAEGLRKAESSIEKFSEFYKKDGKELSGKEILEATYKDHYTRLRDYVQGVKTGPEIDQIRAVASHYKPSPFMEQIFSFAKEEGMAPELIDRSKVELGYMMEDLKTTFREKNPKTPAESLAVIHDYIHEKYQFNYQGTPRFLDYVGLHRLDCDAASALFYEAGKQLGLPIEFRGTLAPLGPGVQLEGVFQNKGLHSFIAWVEPGGKEHVLWEPLAKNPAERKYDPSHPRIAHRVHFSANSFLSSQYLEANKEVFVNLAFTKMINQALGMPKDHPDLIAKNKVIERALQIDPLNVQVYLRDGMYDKAIEVAKQAGGNEVANWVRAQVDEIKKKEALPGIKIK